MGYIIEITEDKKEKMSKYCEEMLRAGGMLMQCLESLDDESMGSRMGYRGDDDDDWGYRGRMGHREEDDDYKERFGMRRGRGGRYSRY